MTVEIVSPPRHIALSEPAVGLEPTTALERPAQETPQRYTDALGPEQDSIGIYVHFPWCVKKCPYCDFLSIPSQASEIPHEAYADAVLRELAERAPDYAGRRVHSIFFGGGTPSLWSSSALGRVLSAITTRFELEPSGIEITAECNPGSLTPRKADELRALGVSRLSIGVQALEQERLTFLGRWHSVPEGLAAVRAAVAAGFGQISADLIFGVAGESAGVAAAETTQLLDLGLTHLSAYALTLEPGTRFYAQHQRGRLPLLPEGEVAASFEAVSAAVQARGLRHYEISNFCVGNFGSVHNLGYWRGNDYLGLGCGAWGTLTEASEAGLAGLRYRNSLVVERYMATPAFGRLKQATRPALHSVEELTAETLACERLMLGLRTDTGVCLDSMENALGIAVRNPERLRAATKLAGRGRLQVEGSRWWIPRDQWLFADDTIARLL